MATKTLGTNATTSLTAVAYSPAPATLSDADLATIKQAIVDPSAMAAVPSTQVYPGAFVRQGFLIVPQRGILKVLAGDYVGVDAAGWPILVSSQSIAYASTSWAHS